MAEAKQTLPKITTKNWWGIRKKLKSTMPKVISKSFVAAAMGVGDASAQGNVISPMIQLGLLDENGAPTKLANEWRNDDTYASACKKMREATYPQELCDLAPDMEIDKGIVQNWIGSHLMVGAEAARQCASVYMLLLEADPTKQTEAANNSATPKKIAPPAKRNAVKPASKKEQPKDDGTGAGKKVKTSFDQSMNINIQIHISSDTSADQIDKIFSSMAKHLKSMNEE